MTNIFYPLGERSRLIFELDLTAAATAVGDTFDVFIDALLPDATNYANCIHFPQMLGNGGAKRYVGVLDPANPGAVTFDVSADAAVGVVRPAVFGSAYRGRYTVVSASAPSFTFSCTVYAVSHGVP
jgi:hypothetical protein